MHNDYIDIRSRIKEEPTWYDENGVPRYGEFNPSLISNIYASEVALVLIGCQNCDKTFNVVISCSLADRARLFIQNNKIIDHPIADSIIDGTIHYGDPPNHCDTDFGGSTMNCLDLKILQYWRNNFDGDLERNHDFEIDLPELTGPID